MTIDLIRGATGALALLAASSLALPALAFDAAKQPTVVTQLTSTQTTDAGQPIVLPQKDARVIASIFEIAPGATLPVHKHTSARYAYVLAGELRVTNADTGATKDYKTGDFVIEMIDRWHQGTNIGAGAIRLLVIDQVEGDAPHTVLKP